MKTFRSPGLYLRRRFIYAGLREGNRKWLVIGGAAWLLHYARRLFTDKYPVPVYTEDLEPGEKLLITHIPRPDKRRR